MLIKTDLQKLTPSAIIELFEFDATSLGGAVYRFHPGKNELVSDIQWNGQTYTAFPIEVSGFEWNGKGQLPRPTALVSNVLGTITSLVLAHQDLVGCKFTRIRTLAKYLDIENFPVLRNLHRNSENLNAWTKANVTVVSAADMLDIPAWDVSNTPSANSYLLTTLGQTLANSTTYVRSVYGKAVAGLNRVIFESYTGTTNITATFDLANGTVVGGANATIENMGGGVYRCKQYFTTAATGTPTANVLYIGAYGSTPTATTVRLTGSQVELGTVPTAYQKIGSVWSRNPTADPTAEFARDVFYVDRKARENKDFVEFELASALDLAGLLLPRRQIIQNYCPWLYRGAECGYAGTNYFDTNDAVVGSAGLDVCGKRLSSCKARFGQYAELPYGAFPAAGLVRI